MLNPTMDTATRTKVALNEFTLEENLSHIKATLILDGSIRTEV